MSSATEIPFIDTTVLSAAATAELEDWGPLEEATGGAMQTSGVTLWSSADGSQDVGVWQCTAGPSYWVQEETEVVYLLSGSMTVTPDDGKPVKLGPGDMAVFPRGWRGPWELHETVRKVYVIF